MTSAFLGELRRILGAAAVLQEPLDLLTYECDGLLHLRGTPAAVVLPGSTAEVQAVVRLCARNGVPFVPRGHGTGLSGGAVPVSGSVVIALSRFNRVLDVDIPNQRATVQPGVTNLEITRAVAPFGYYYAPDPSSQQVCSIGGNVAENSGGAHCLKYGFTVHHVLEVEAVLPDGTIVHLGGPLADTPGPDLLGLVVCSEGTLAVVTSVTVRILRRPETVQTLLAAFDTIDAGGAVVSDLIGGGIIPAAVEMMDALAIRAVEAAVHPGFPPADTVLIVELDGPATEVRALFEIVEETCRARGATTVEVAQSDERRARIWRGRKAAFAAMGRVSPNYYVQDGVVPRTRLPEVLNRIRLLEARSGLRIGNVFHAGDGNLHPLICYDERVAGQADKAAEVAAEILSYCLDAGGSLTGEHGIGIDKACSMPKMFTDDDLALMQRVRAAFDPQGLCNPDKVFPTPRLCGEVPGPYRRHPVEQAGLAERF
ncbi:MAG: glycolate oxidase subunit GlcD [Acidobacteria bacterium RIFCSPLOWO2_12_FULL_66_10]|nr:MAG: glycolate oxidase subunit GlcD [Acidobacteria bacterium RIFCSPLOWO2_12_FULL_66_10]